MQFSEALQIVANHYEPGTIAHFSKMTPDPWQELHDQLEAVLAQGDPEKIELAAEVFAQRVVGLIDDYKRAVEPSSRKVSPHDAFFLGFERTAGAQSRQSKTCRDCLKPKTKLKAFPIPESNEVFLLCRDCQNALYG